MLGRERATIKGRTLLDFVAAESRQQFAGLARRLHSEEGKHTAMVIFLKSGGVPVYTLVEAFRCKDAYRAVVVDITSMQQAELARRHSDERLKLAVEAAQIGVWEWDRESGQIYWTPECFQIFGLSQLSISLETLKQLVHPEDRERFVAALAQKQSGDRPGTMDIRIVRPDGDVAWIQTVWQVQHGLGGGPSGVVGTARDITERMRGEAQLRGALGEKEALIKAMRQRVRNTLALVISMIELQTERMPGEARGKLRELETHARTMAFAHEALARSAQVGKVDFGAFLAMLADQLRAAVAGNESIALETGAPEVALDVDTAVQCGLIVSELLTDAFRHALPGARGRKACRVSVGMRRKGNLYTLTVSDNGVGLPSDREWRSKRSLGLQIVDMLSRQLGGQIELQRSRGTEFKLTFREH
jgi:PAS domain S-box-containing protein